MDLVAPDAGGVHALGQVAHVDFDTNLNIQAFKNALNAKLPARL